MSTLFYKNKEQGEIILIRQNYERLSTGLVLEVIILVLYYINYISTVVKRNMKYCKICEKYCRDDCPCFEYHKEEEM